MEVNSFEESLASISFIPSYFKTFRLIMVGWVILFVPWFFWLQPVVLKGYLFCRKVISFWFLVRHFPTPSPFLFNSRSVWRQEMGILNLKCARLPRFHFSKVGGERQRESVEKRVCWNVIPWDIDPERKGRKLWCTFILISFAWHLERPAFSCFSVGLKKSFVR